MSRILVIHGAGMNMRGRAEVDIFGPMTLEELTDEILDYGRQLDLDVEVFHSNVEGEIVNRLYDAHDRDVSGALINPAGFMMTTGPLPHAIAQVRFPVVEVHISNPAARGSVSTTVRSCIGSVAGFGSYGYYLALAGIAHAVADQRASP